MWSLPACISSEVIQRAFNQKTGGNDRVRSCTVTRANSSESVLRSAIFRLQVKGKRNTVYFIFKRITKDDQLRYLFVLENFFKREVHFYARIAPMLSFSQSCRDTKENLERHLPVCYAYYTDGINDYLILEDLSDRGLQVVRGVHRNECKLALDTLAHLHAVSMVMKKRTDYIFNVLVRELDEIYYTADKKIWFAPFLNKCIAVLKEALREHEKGYSVYYRKFLELTVHDLYDTLVELASKRSELACITHGNCSMENFMLSNDAAIAIDFQLVRHTSPAHDLVFFLLMNQHTNGSAMAFKEGIIAYYESLEHYITDLKVDPATIMTLDQLWKEVQQNSKFPFLQLFTAIPMLSMKRRSPGLFGMFRRTNSLDVIFNVKPLDKEEDQLRFVRALRVAVDLKLI